MEKKLKVAIWVLVSAFSAAFACHFAPVMPLACYIFFWIMFCFNSLVVFYGLFLHRKPLHGPANMAYFPSLAAGQGSGSPHGVLQPDQPAAFDHSDHNLLDEGLAPASFGQPESAVPPLVDAGQTAIQMSGSSLAGGSPRRRGVESPRAVEEAGITIIRTMSDVDILDDGYKWRTNGKHFVKNSIFPRSYYRCATEACSVKKRVQRDDEDPSYVGTHNHV